MIPQRNISILSNRLAKEGGRRIPEAVLERDYCLAYSLEEILSEKVIALADRARNEPRDLYDVWYLTEQEGMDPAELIPGISDKLEFRGRGLEGMGEEFGKKESPVEKTMADETQ